MAVMEWDKVDETVAVITMTNGENRHNPAFVKAILQIFDEVERDESVTSIIVTSNDAKNWSQGMDLAWMLPFYEGKKRQELKDFMYNINDMFKRILHMPMPVIAAINGHVFGNGAIMACCCDFRFMRSDRGFFCFPEIDNSIPFMPGTLPIIKKAFPYYKLEEAVLSGKRYSGAELATHHVIVKACADRTELMKESIAFGKSFNKQRPICGEIKKRLNKEIIQVMDTEDPALIEPLDLIVWAGFRFQARS